ncbi:hypothetical protein B0H14DRAFT_2628214 [Mycena olivaceomarginata]|nr:hypothetical protein B0H14DRAFT_2628214 [Mycena olivaceomarginata]
MEERVYCRGRVLEPANDLRARASSQGGTLYSLSRAGIEERGGKDEGTEAATVRERVVREEYKLGVHEAEHRANLRRNGFTFKWWVEGVVRTAEARLQYFTRHLFAATAFCVLDLKSDKHYEINISFLRHLPFLPRASASYPVLYHRMPPPLCALNQVRVCKSVQEIAPHALKSRKHTALLPTHLPRHPEHGPNDVTFFRLYLRSSTNFMLLFLGGDTTEKNLPYVILYEMDELDVLGHCDGLGMEDNSNGKPGFSEKPFASEKSLNIQWETLSHISGHSSAITADAILIILIVILNSLIGRPA